MFKLARLLGHNLAPHRLDGDQPGSFLACHAEKQLLAFMLWNHTTASRDVSDEAQLNDCEPTRFSRLGIKIFVYQPAREQACVCDDCISFCAKAADRFDMTLALYSVGEIWSCPQQLLATAVLVRSSQQCYSLAVEKSATSRALYILAMLTAYFLPKPESHQNLDKSKTYTDRSAGLGPPLQNRLD